MGKIKLALIDDNIDLCDILTNQFRTNYGNIIDVIGTANDGSKGIELIRKGLPDIALIDVVMPEQDGIEVVRTIKKDEMTRNVTCIMLSAMTTDFAAISSSLAGADYFCRKPFDVKKLVGCIKEVSDYKKQMGVFVNREEEFLNAGSHKPDPEAGTQSACGKQAIIPRKFAEAVLKEIGVPFMLKGYNYLKTSIVYCIEDTENLDMLTKMLYPRVAKKYKSNAMSIERAMRHAISQAWIKGRPHAFYAMNGQEMPELSKSPSTGSFLRAVMNKYNSFE